MKRIALFLTLTLPALAADQAIDIVKYRQMVMKAMSAHMKAVSMIATKANGAARLSWLRR